MGHVAGGMFCTMVHEFCGIGFNQCHTPSYDQCPIQLHAEVDLWLYLTDIVFIVMQQDIYDSYDTSFTTRKQHLECGVSTHYQSQVSLIMPGPNNLYIMASPRN